MRKIALAIANRIKTSNQFVLIIIKKKYIFKNINKKIIIFLIFIFIIILFLILIKKINK